ncbi:LuxR C-terminal-related transcriptional regulator [Acetobacter oeni]|uniref:LuxR C-terminal-related transcriptional regulator n=1 Tax=Acetobacter oeni TaxID=304077 RepID=UPI0017DFE957|nr:DNA-binding NarL/FixJ family response regulator [Acetobacter oeni]
MVLSWTVSGRRQLVIADIPGLSERTIDNHLRRIRKRLGASTTYRPSASRYRMAILKADVTTFAKDGTPLK